MDQVRAIAKVLWTQRFWVLSVICVIVGVVCWNMAATEVSDKFTKRKNAIDGAFRDVTGIRGEAAHPNNDVNNGDLKQAVLQRDNVRSVWEDLYQEQRSKVLYWPKSLGDDFVQKIEGKKFGDEISSTMRDRYLNYIENRFNALLEIVKAKKTAKKGSSSRRGAPGGGGGYGYGGGGESAYGAGIALDDEEDKDYLVQWLDQQNLQGQLFFKKKPSAMKVWVTQENLWVYETLLHVIANTNKARGATRPENTAVRVIVALEVGSKAAMNKSTGVVYIPKSQGGDTDGRGGYGGGGYGYGEGRGGGGGGYGDGGGGGYGYGAGRGGGRPDGYGDGGGEAADTTLLANRYLDAEGNPDPAESGTFGTTEYRQLPIHMVLMMDQRWIPQVLIECANAALPIEVKQLRVNPKQSASAGVSGKTSKRGGRINKNLRGLAPDSNLAEVEIRGAVYIYNEPDEASLVVPGAEDETVDGSI